MNEAQTRLDLIDPRNSFPGTLFAVIFNSLEFEGIKTWIVDLLPNTEKENSIIGSKPIFNESPFAIKATHHVQ